MLRVASITRKPAVKPELVADTVILDHEARGKKALKLFGEGGTIAEFSSEKEPGLKDGDAFRLEDGRLLLVKAADEKLLRITAENPLRLVRLAWQLGSRHVAVEAAADVLFVENDPALEELVRGQGCSSEIIDRPFNPEQAVHGHDCCDHDHGHDHHHHHGHHHHHEHGDDGHCGCGGHGKHEEGHQHGHGHRHDDKHEH